MTIIVSAAAPTRRLSYAEGTVAVNISHLDWRERAVRFHPGGCRLCCTFRIQTSGGLLVHPGDKRSGVAAAECPQCGAVWTNRQPDLCRLCGKTAHFLDQDGHPVHKTCLEQEIARRDAVGRGRG